MELDRAPRKNIVRDLAVGAASKIAKDTMDYAYGEVKKRLFQGSSPAKAKKAKKDLTKFSKRITGAKRQGPEFLKKKKTPKTKVYKGTGAGLVNPNMATDKTAGVIFANKSVKVLKGKKKIAKRGLVKTFEVGGNVTSEKCVYLGHATMARNRIAREVWGAVIKNFFFKTGVRPGKTTENTPMGVGDTIRLWYRVNSDPATGFSNQDFVIAAAPPQQGTIDQVAAGYHAWAISNVTGDFEFRNFEYIPTSVSGIRYVSFPLTGSKVTINLSSKLKIQNRSLAANDATDSEAVGATHLVGYVYEGKGTGVKWAQNTQDAQVVLTANQESVIRYDPAADGIVGLYEPPEPYMLPECKQWSKFTLESGQMKTSYLKSNDTMLWNSFIRLFYPTNTTVTYKNEKRGHYRLMAIEKQIQSRADGITTPDIDIAYECDIKFTVGFKNGYAKFTHSPIEELRAQDS